MMISSNPSEVVSDRAVEAATLAELRRANSDAAAVAQLVDLVEQIDNVEADFDCPDLWNGEDALKRGIDGFVWMTFFRVGETSPQSVAVEEISGRLPIIPGPGDAG